MSDWNSSGGDAWAAGSSDNWKNGTNTNGDTWDGQAANTIEFNDDFDKGEDGNNGATEGQGDQAGGACRNCGQDGHFARECPEPRKMGPCFNCDEEGHSKAECTKPRVFRGTCNICNEEGHPAARCPSKPKSCTRCKEQGDHDTKDCKNNFYLNLDEVPDMPEATAWAKVVKACFEDDMDDFKDALRMLQKAAPELTYLAIEKKLRAKSANYYLIGLKKEVGDGYTLVNLQGEPEQKFALATFKSPMCPRPNMVDKWPTSPEENLERLARVGIPMERGLSYCRTCENFGHETRSCDQEKVAVEGPTIQCVLCGEIGHRVRDCKEPRQKPREPRTCRVCGSEDHVAKECDQKPAMTCHNCGGDHKAADCTEPRKVICHNCNEEGHARKDCPKPIDYSKATCRHCGQKGHLSASRCAPGAAKKEDENVVTNGTVENGADTAADEWASNDNVTTGGDWHSGTAVPEVSTGSW